MTHSEIYVTPRISLIPYYDNYAAALPWYQDPVLCKQVDNRDTVYDLDTLKRMYHYLNTHGDLFYIQCDGILCGDVCLQSTGELAIVLCKEYQNRHIGRAVIQKILELAQTKGFASCWAHIYSFNAQSRKMFLSLGFVQREEEHFEFTF